MNSQEVATLILNVLIALFFLILAIRSYQTSKNIKSILDMKSDDANDGIKGATITIDGFDIGELFKKLARAISELSWGSLTGFILSSFLLVWQIYFLIKP